MKSKIKKLFSFHLIIISFFLFSCSSFIDEGSPSGNAAAIATFIAKTESITTTTSYKKVSFYDDKTFTIFQVGHSETEKNGFQSTLDEEFLIASGTYTGNPALSYDRISFTITKAISDDVMTKYMAFISDEKNYTFNGTKASIKITSSLFNYDTVSVLDNITIQNQGFTYDGVTYENIRKPVSITWSEIMTGKTGMQLKFIPLENAVKYTIYFSENLDVSSASVLGTIATAKPDSSGNLWYELPSDRLVIGKKYYLWIKAELISGDVSELYSSYSLTYRTLAAPSTSKQDNKLVINPVSNATSYRIFRSETSDVSTAVLLATITDVSTPYQDTTITKSGSYYYWVKALNDLEESEYSDMEVIMYEIITISAPQLYSISRSFDTDTFTLYWRAPEIGTAVSYDIYVSSKQSSGYIKIKTVTELSVDISSKDVPADSELLKKSGEIYFGVTAKNAENEESKIGSLPFNYDYYPVLMPNNLVLTVNDRTISLSWDAVQNASYYKVYCYREKILELKPFPGKDDFTEISDRLTATSFTVPSSFILSGDAYQYEFRVKAFSADDIPGPESPSKFCQFTN